jgi:hypothetical protein
MSSESESESFKGVVEALVKRKVLSPLQMSMASQYMLTDTAEPFNYLGMPISAELCSSTLNEESYEYLRLDDTWPVYHSSSTATSVLVPPFIKDMIVYVISAIESIWETKGKPHFFLGGSPGLGKSVFFQILIYFLVEKYGKSSTVIRYQPIPSKNRLYVFFEGQTYIALEGLNAEIACGKLMMGWVHEKVGKRRMFWIVDSNDPPMLVNNRRAAVLCVTSPGNTSANTYIKKWLHSVNIQLIMRQWTYTELDILRRICYPNVPEALLRNRYIMFGGNPRSLLDKAFLESHEQLLKSTIEKVDLEKAMREVGEQTASAVETASLIFYYCPSARPSVDNVVIRQFIQSGHWTWASKWCLEKATTSLLTRELGKVKRFLQTAHSGGQQAMRGNIYESVIH